MARKPRKARIDSAAEAVAVMIKAARVIEPPAHSPLDDDALPFWDDIVEARAKAEWTGHDLSCASDLANAMAQLVTNRRTLRAEGEVLHNDKGTAYARRLQKSSKTFAEAYMGPGGDGNAKAPPQGVQQEFGNKNHGPQPFMRPAWDAGKAELLDGIQDDLWAEIDKAAQRAARKTARLAKKG